MLLDRLFVRSNTRLLARLFAKLSARVHAPRPVVLAAAMLIPPYAVAYEETTTLNELPPIWQDASGHQMVAGIKAAEAIARRNFAARVKGIRLDGQTTVADIVQTRNNLRAQVDQMLAGVTISPPRFREDGRVQVTATGIVRDIFTSIEQDIAENKQFWSGTIRRDEFLKISEEIRDQPISVIGESALPGTLGEKRLRWLLLARLDAMSKLLARLEGVQINANTTIGDFMLHNDHVSSQLGALLTGAKLEKVDFSHPKYVSVQMSLKMAEVIEIISHNADQGQEETHIDQQVRESVFSETGIGSEDSADPHIQQLLQTKTIHANDTVTQPLADDMINMVLERRIRRHVIHE